jgi:hypothetical protein
VSLDRVGIGASALCMIHCALLPVVALAVPVVGGAWLGSEAFSYGAIAAAAVAAVGAFSRGYRVHGVRWPVLLAAAGIGVLVVGERASDGSLARGVVLSLVGGGTMVIAHLVNLRLCRRCADCAAARKPDR